jgi:hypothetical protein
MKYRRSAREVIRKLENWWPWHFWGDDDDDEEKVDMDLNPVLLVPGIGGSILHAVDQNGRFKERIWVRLFEADHEFRTKLYSFYNPTTGPEFFEILEPILCLNLVQYPKLVPWYASLYVLASRA